MSTEEPNPPPAVEFWRNPRWWRAWLVSGFGPMFWAFAGIAVASGALVWWLQGSDAFWQALYGDAAMVLDTLPRVLAAVSVAGALWVLIPRERMKAVMQRGKGFWGLVVAAGAGMITPGGPTSAFSLLAMFGGMGADRGMLIAYIASWATLGLQRILVWDVPMMGADFSVLRFAATLPLPILAGLLARALPIDLVLKEERRLRDLL